MTRDEALALADRILALVNSRPTTPTRDELAGLLEWAPECADGHSLPISTMLEVGDRLREWQPTETAPKERWVICRGDDWDGPAIAQLRETWVGPVGVPTQWRWYDIRGRVCPSGDDAPTWWLPVEIPELPNRQTCAHCAGPWNDGEGHERCPPEFRGAQPDPSDAWAKGFTQGARYCVKGGALSTNTCFCGECNAKHAAEEKRIADEA